MRSIHGSSDAVTPAAKLHARCCAQTAILLTCVTESCKKFASSKAVHQAARHARAEHRTGFFRAPTAARRRQACRHCFHCSGIVFSLLSGTRREPLGKRIFPRFIGVSCAGRDRPRHCFFFVISNDRMRTCVRPYPPRAARNSCGVVPVCLRKNLAKWEGSENARS